MSCPLTEWTELNGWPRQLHVVHLKSLTSDETCIPYTQQRSLAASLLSHPAEEGWDATGQLTTVYTTIVRSVMEYACQVWHMGLTDKQSEITDSIQKHLMVIAFPDLSEGDALAMLGLPTLHNRRKNLCRRLFQAMLQPKHRLHHLLPEKRNTGYGLGNSNKYLLIAAHHVREHWSVTVCGADSNFSSQWARSSDGLYWQFPTHCFVIIDRLYFLSLIVHILAHYGTSNCEPLYEFNLLQ